MIDFNKTNVNDASVHLSRLEVFRHLAFAAKTMQWFCDIGGVQLEVSLADNRLVWDLLMEKVFILYRDLPGTRSVKELLVLVVEHGIDDVTELAKDTRSDKPTVINWIRYLLNFVDPGKFCGFNGGACSAQKTCELLEKLMVAAQEAQSPQLIVEIASNIAQGNETILKLLADHYTTD
jgi:hypothetical protein